MVDGGNDGVSTTVDIKTVCSPSSNDDDEGEYDKGGIDIDGDMNTWRRVTTERSGIG